VRGRQHCGRHMGETMCISEQAVSKWLLFPTVSVPARRAMTHPTDDRLCSNRQESHDDPHAWANRCSERILPHLRCHGHNGSWPSRSILPDMEIKPFHTFLDLFQAFECLKGHMATFQTLAQELVAVGR